MKINMLQPLVGIDGVPMTDGKDPLSLRGALYLSLKSYPEGEIPSAEKASKIYALIKKIYSGDEISFTSNETVFLKEKVGAGLSSAEAAGLIIEILEPPSKS